MEISINKTNLSTDGEDYNSQEDDKTFDNKNLWDKLLIWNLPWNKKEYSSFYELSFSNKTMEYYAALIKLAKIHRQLSI